MTSDRQNAMHLRFALFAVVVAGLSACTSREPATDAERLARGRELVQQMSTRLASAKIVRVTTTETRDVVSVGGRKATVAQTGEYVVERPNHFYAKMTGGRNLESWYNGKTLTIASHNEKVFAQAPMPDTIDRTLDALAERYDMPLPMGDLFYGSPEKALISATTTGGYAGTENVGGTPCVHLAFHDVGVDWELWLPTQGDPLPKRFKVVQKSRTGQPAVDLTFAAWEFTPQISKATFTPKVPADYEGIAVVQRAAAVKRAAADPPAPPPASAAKQ